MRLGLCQSVIGDGLGPSICSRWILGTFGYAREVTWSAPDEAVEILRLISFGLVGCQGIDFMCLPPFVGLDLGAVFMLHLSLGYVGRAFALYRLYCALALRIRRCTMPLSRRKVVLDTRPPLALHRRTFVLARNRGHCSM